MDICAGKCIAPSGGPLPIIAHGCPNFDLLQKWATGASPPRVSNPKAVAKSARKLPGTTRHRRPVLVGGAAAQVSEYRTTVAPVLSIGTTTEKRGGRPYPRDPHFAMYLLQSIEKFVQTRANSCMTPLSRCRKRGWAAHIVHGSCRVVRRLGGGVRGKTPARQVVQILRRGMLARAGRDSGCGGYAG
jgi:hypothetical protein